MIQTFRELSVTIEPKPIALGRSPMMNVHISLAWEPARTRRLRTGRDIDKISIAKVGIAPRSRGCTGKEPVKRCRVPELG